MMAEQKLLFVPMSEEYSGIAEKILNTDPISANYHLSALSERPKNLTAVIYNGELAALLLVNDPAPTSFQTVFVAQKFRARGIGKTAVRYGEDILRAGGTKIIRSYFDAKREDSRFFARSLGYEKYFMSSKMERCGEPFVTEALPVRLYRDEDYPSAHEMYARAFHEMRVRVGCFPDSVVEKPSEKSRREWNEKIDGDSRYIYEENGEIVAYSHVCKNEIGSISVRCECQGRGIGRKFIKYLCNEIYRQGYDTVVLWCVVGNRARELYDSLGFTEMYTAEFPRKKL